MNVKKAKNINWKKVVKIILIVFLILKLISLSGKNNRLEEENKNLKSFNQSEQLMSRISELEKKNAELTTEIASLKSNDQQENTKPVEVAENNEPKSEKSQPVEQAKEETTVPQPEPKNDVPREYKNALRAAEDYIAFAPFSKQGLYDQLTSEYGNKYPAEAAQYAIDNLDVDYKEQALKAAQNYLEMTAFSDAGLKDQLMSEYGDKYTEEEAQYAIDNLEW